MLTTGLCADAQESVYYFSEVLLMDSTATENIMHDNIYFVINMSHHEYKATNLCLFVSTSSQIGMHRWFLL